MGQDWIVANLDRKEFFDGPDAEPDALTGKLPCGYGSGAALLLLMSCPPEREVGNRAGSWAGDRVVVLGDHAKPEQKAYMEMYGPEMADYEDISRDVFVMLATAAGVGRPDRLR